MAGIKLMHMIGKGQLLMKGIDKLSFADQFYALAGQSVQLNGQVQYCANPRPFVANATEPEFAMVGFVKP